MCVYIIAEAGVNHNGDINVAQQMIAIADDAGVNAIKFQSFTAESLVTRKAVKASYQKDTTGERETQFEMLKKLELNIDAHKILSSYCKKKGIDFLSSAFDLDTIDLLASLKINTWKIPSGEITNLPYLRKIGAFNQNIILSTGMADLGEIEDALDVLEAAGTPRQKITILHCNTEYPTPMEDVNLLAMKTIQSAFPGVNVGYSDHTVGIEVPIAAVALGARIIEKHFTLDRNMEGPDHRASLEPEELKAMVSAIRNIEKALGTGIKKPSLSEQKNLAVARKSIIASKPVQAGETFTEHNLTVKRPGTGISPMRWDEILGKKADQPYNEDDLINA